MALGMVLLGATYFIKSNKNILICSIVNAMLFCGHYLFLGAYTGLVLNVLGIVRGVWYYCVKNSTYKSKTIAMIIVVVANIIMGMITLSQWVDILAMVASTHYCFAIWQKNILYYRWTAIVEGIYWIIYNFYFMSIVGIVSQSALLLVGIIGVLKYYYDLKKNNILKSAYENKEKK